jgi:YHS domain-containing protein
MSDSNNLVSNVRKGRDFKHDFTPNQIADERSIKTGKRIHFKNDLNHDRENCILCSETPVCKICRKSLTNLDEILVVGGGEHLFCSESCLDKFLDPNYLKNR